VAAPTHAVILITAADSNDRAISKPQSPDSQPLVDGIIVLGGEVGERITVLANLPEIFPKHDWSIADRARPLRRRGSRNLPVSAVTENAYNGKTITKYVRECHRPAGHRAFVAPLCHAALPAVARFPMRCNSQSTVAI
jgi:hypothetical protein